MRVLCALSTTASHSAMQSRGVQFSMVNGEEDDGVDSEHGTLLTHGGTASDGQPVRLFAAGEDEDTLGGLQGGPAGGPVGGPSTKAGTTTSGPSPTVRPTGVLGAMARGVQVDVHACVQEDGVVAAVHDNADDFDPATEDSFKYLQVLLVGGLCSL